MVPVSLGAADALVVAGGARFAAHAALLAAHSGYFRAALAERAQVGVLHAPDLSAQQFWPLLAYMYTGYLELSPENAYQVLLGAHLLRMPRALDLCRSFLGGCRPPIARHTVVKPIASRKPPPFPPPPIGPPRGETSLGSRTPADAGEEISFRVRRAPSPPERPSSARDEPEEPEEETDGGRDEGRDEEAAAAEEPSSSRSGAGAPKKPPERKVVFDVACCDGPVRFRRVPNAAYGGSEDREKRATSDSEDSYVEVEEDARSPLDGRSAFDRSLQKQMNEDIRSKREGAAYACAYCNHAFKSQYCYQKHARRHLNPVSIDGGPAATAAAAPAVEAEAEAPKREVRPLDMNVQYYPCKTCGSKFPSYYFVHKHRKMCHAEELDGEAKAPPERKRKAAAAAPPEKPQ